MVLAVDAVGDLVIDSFSIARYFQIRVFICIHICLIADRRLTDIDLVEVEIFHFPNYLLPVQRNVVVPRACLPGALDGRAQCNRTQRFVIFKIAAIGILVAVLNQVLSRAGRDEQAMMTTLAGLVVVLMMVVQEIADLFALVKNLFQL